MKKRQRRRPEEILEKLQELEQLLQTMTLESAAQHMGVTTATLHRWRNQYGGLKAHDAQRLKELETENRRLTQRVHNQELDIAMLKEINQGNSWARRSVGNGSNTSGNTTASPRDEPVASSVNRDRRSVACRAKFGERPEGARVT
ncbi:MAG: transposase [Planctomycetota bacterium]